MDSDSPTDNSSTADPGTAGESSSTSPFWRDSTLDEPAVTWTEDEVASIGVADQLRRGLHALIAGEHDVATLEQVRRDLDVALHALDASPPKHKELGKWESPDMIEPPAVDTPFTNSLTRPVSGPGNPWSIPLHVVRRGEEAVTVVTLGAGYEGAPERAHGGVVSAIFDDLCGFLLTLQRVIAFTASLTVNYHAGTPLHEPITYRGWVERTDGRKLYLKAECRRGDEDPDGELITSCEALFISIDPLSF